MYKSKFEGCKETTSAQAFKSMGSRRTAVLDKKGLQGSSMRSKMTRLATLSLFFYNLMKVEGFNSNLPPPWIARSKIIDPINTGARARARTNSKPKEEKIHHESSSNSGSPASKEPETNNANTLTHEDEEVVSKLKEQEFKHSDKYATVTGALSSLHSNPPQISSSSTPLVKVKPPVINPAIRPHLTGLLKMCRLSNLPGVVMLHIVGTYVATSSKDFITTLVKPSMVLVLLSLIITSCSSMVVNDYYDARSGVDIYKKVKNPPAVVIKKFLTYMYTCLLTMLVFLPGKISRMSVVSASLLTFWYTQHLKPKTWIKNVTCAGLVALSPFTSAAATCYTSNQPLSKALGKVLQISSILFLGVMGREIWMDVLDEEGDRKGSVRTVPVVHGKRKACHVVLALTSVMAVISVMGSLIPLLYGEAPGRRLALSLIGSGMVMKRALEIVKSNGMDLNLIASAIEEGKLALLFLMMSFI